MRGFSCRVSPDRTALGFFEGLGGGLVKSRLRVWDIGARECGFWAVSSRGFLWSGLRDAVGW